MEKRGFFLVLFSIFFIAFILLTPSASGKSAELVDGLRDIEQTLRGVNAIGSPFDNADKNNQCKFPLFGEMAFALGDGLNTDETLALFKEVFGPIIDIIKSNPVIGGIFDAYDIYDALNSADTLEKFKEILKKKAKEKAVEKGSEIADVDLEDAVDGLEKLWEEHNQKAKNANLGVEIFDIPPRGDCDTHVFGMWQRSTGRLIITAVGDCKCKRYDTGEFTISVIGKINAYTDRDGKVKTNGVYETSTYDSECPCKKESKVSYNFLDDDGLYTFLTNEKDGIDKGIQDAPKFLTNLVGKHSNVVFVLKKDNSEKEKVYLTIRNEEGKQGLFKVSKEMAETPTLSITSTALALKSISEAPDKFSAIQHAINTNNIAISVPDFGGRAVFGLAVFGSRIYGAVTPGAFSVSKNEKRDVTYAGVPSKLALTPTGAKIVTPVQNPAYSFVVNKHGAQQGYMTPQSSALLSYGTKRYSSSAGIYQSTPPKTVTTLGGYPASTAFVVGAGYTQGARFYKA